jgi:prevent-host-death family protein
MRVTTAEFIKNYGRLADAALGEPVIITKNGHDRLVVMSVAEYEKLKRNANIDEALLSVRNWTKLYADTSSTSKKT